MWARQSSVRCRLNWCGKYQQNSTSSAGYGTPPLVRVRAARRHRADMCTFAQLSKKCISEPRAASTESASIQRAPKIVFFDSSVKMKFPLCACGPHAPTPEGKAPPLPKLLELRADFWVFGTAGVLHFAGWWLPAAWNVKATFWVYIRQARAAVAHGFVCHRQLGQDQRASVPLRVVLFCKSHEEVENLLCACGPRATSSSLSSAAGGLHATSSNPSSAAAKQRAPGRRQGAPRVVFLQISRRS